MLYFSMKFFLKLYLCLWSGLPKFQVNRLSIEFLAILCSKGPPARKDPIFNDSAKTAVSAVLRSTPSRQQNRAAGAKLSMPFGQNFGEVLAKK